MLVIHGQLDYRIPVSQGISAFTALQRKGIESKFLYFPDENHWVLKPANSILWHDTVNGWLKQHLAPQQSPGCPHAAVAPRVSSPTRTVPMTDLARTPPIPDADHLLACPPPPPVGVLPSVARPCLNHG